RKIFGIAVRVGAGDRGVPHPDLLVGPAFELRAGAHRLPEQRPLRAMGRAGGIREVRGHVPPFDAEFRMRTVIEGEDEVLAGHDRRKTVSRLAQSSETLRTRPAPKANRKRATDERAARYRMQA